METEKLYEADPFLKEFTARILSCQVGKRGFQVVLDRTAFYPEGGGQPADHGSLDGKAVTDVQEKDGVVFHTVEKQVEIGEIVTGVLDWDRRFDHMQQHSGEHILSGILCADYHCDNVGFHMGADTVTIDYNTGISWAQVLEAEEKANEILYADRPVEITFPSSTERSALSYRSKKELTGRVRIVTFPGADCCACCGTHVSRAGQVDLIKVLSCQAFRDGVRLEIVCGRRALSYLRKSYEQSRAVGQLLSVKPLETLAAVERMTEEISATKAREVRIEEQLFSTIADNYGEKGDVVLFQPALRPDSVRKLADAVARRCGGLAAVFAGEGDRYAYALVRSDGGDLHTLVQNLNQTLHGRGGGRNGFAQGSIQAERPAVEAFFKK